MKWVKSSRCGSATCIEVADGEGGTVHLRDSKHPDTVLTFTADEWTAFVRGVDAGEFRFGG